jgi:hypothetical protein
MNFTCVPLTDTDNQAVDREDRAMLRSNPSARVDARAWAAILLSLLIFSPHAWAANAINLLKPYIRTLPTLETPWLPFGKISGAKIPIAFELGSGLRSGWGLGGGLIWVACLLTLSRE